MNSKVATTATTVVEGIQTAATSVKETASDVASSATGKVKSLSSGAKKTARSTVGGAIDTYKDNLSNATSLIADPITSRISGNDQDDDSSDSDNSGESTIQKVQLYAHEQPTQAIFEISGVVTAAWLKPERKLEESEFETSIKHRVREIVQLNPWLSGWLVLKKKVTTSPAYLKWHALDAEQQEDNEVRLNGLVDRVFQSKIDWTDAQEGVRDAIFAQPETAGTSQFDSSAYMHASEYLRNECTQTSMPMGFGLLSKHPLFKVSWDYDVANNRVLVVMSLAHPIADGTTYFQLFQMLLGETKPYALNATRVWNEKADEDCPADFSEFRDDKMGKRNAVNMDGLTSTATCGSINIVTRIVADVLRPAKEEPEQIFLKVNNEGMARVRKQLAGPDGDRKISSNDILMSALTQIFQVDGRWNMWKDFRQEFFQSLAGEHHFEESPEELALKAAGNYIGLVNIFAKEYSPCAAILEEDSEEEEIDESYNKPFSSLKTSVKDKVGSLPIVSSLVKSSKTEEPEAKLRMQSVLKMEPDFSTKNQLNPNRRMANITNWTSLQKTPRALPKEFHKQKNEAATVTNLLSGDAQTKVLLFLPLVEKNPAKGHPYKAGTFTVFHPDFSTNSKGIKNNTWVGAQAHLSFLNEFVAQNETLLFVDGDLSKIEVPFEDIFVL